MVCGGRTNIVNWAVVVAQLVKRSLPTPEVRGSNPVNGEKEAGNGPFKKINQTNYNEH